MNKRAEDLADKLYPFRYDSHGDVIDFKNTIILRGVCMESYEEAEKDTIERAVAWLKEHANDYIVDLTPTYPDAPSDIIIGGKCWDDLTKAMEEE
jgi:hypothetical protein